MISAISEFKKIIEGQVMDYALRPGQIGFMRYLLLFFRPFKPI